MPRHHKIVKDVEDDRMRLDWALRYMDGDPTLCVMDPGSGMWEAVVSVEDSILTVYNVESGALESANMEMMDFVGALPGTPRLVLCAPSEDLLPNNDAAMGNLRERIDWALDALGKKHNRKAETILRNALKASK